MGLAVDKDFLTEIITAFPKEPIVPVNGRHAFAVIRSASSILLIEEVF